MTDHDQPVPAYEPDEFGDESLLPTAERVRRALSSEPPRAAFRDRLRAQLVAARAEAIAAGSGAPGESTAATGTAAAGGAEATAGPVDEPPAGGPGRVVGRVPRSDLPAAPPAERAISRAPVPAEQVPTGLSQPTASAPPSTPSTPPARGAAAVVPSAAGPAPTGPRPTRPGATGPRPTGGGRRGRRRLPRWAWAAAAAVVAIAVAAGVTGLERGLGTGPKVAVSAQSSSEGAISADPAAPVVLRFSKPMNHAATAAALHLNPATALQTAWQGDTLTVTPTHGFAPDSAYLLTIDHTVAATSSGARLAADLHLAFGTAPAAESGSVAAAPVTLSRTTVADAQADSEAVVTANGSLLLTAARSGPGTDGREGLVRIGDGATVRLSADTDAICLSRSGRSVAFLTRSGSGTRIVFADGDGTPSSSAKVAVDAGSPLGWIDDAKVSYVSGGKLRAVDATGHVTTLSATSINAAHDTVALSPGGRYAFVGPATDTGGKLVDLVSGVAHALPGAVGSPAFDGNGATVAWFEASAGRQLIAVAPSGGGPVLTAVLPVRAGDKVSDLALSPDGTHFVYSVAGADGRAELRVATLPDARTVAVSAGGTGESPNFSASGNEFAVLGVDGGAQRIQTVSLPNSVTGRQPAWLGLATAFANAQIGGDGGAQAALAEPGAALPAPPHITRAAVVWGRTAAAGTATVGIRLTIDATSGGAAAREADETLDLGPDAGGILVVRKATVGAWHSAAAGPQLIRLDTTGSPGAVQLVFDADLNAATVPGALTLTTSAGQPVPATVSYDAAHRTATVRPASDSGPATVMVAIGTGLRDIDGHPYAGGSPIAADLSR
jgi:hypothetical protein